MDIWTKGLLTALLLLSSIAARAQCVPHDDQAAFAVDVNFQGSCVLLGIGEYPTATSTHLPNDSISSVRVGADVQVYACRDQNFSGVCTVLHGTHMNMAGDPVGNDAITSIKVQPIGAPPPCDPGPLRVALYVDSNFAGDCKMLAVGEYKTATLTGLPNDSVSSIRVGPGAQVKVCVDEYLSGECALITSDVADMHTTSVGNDRLTSVKVSPLGAVDFDPRCSDVHAKGRFTCPIDRPDVTHAETVSSNIKFAVGDTVYVDGDGCVQTGSHLWSGSTWKRYVNPSGRNADYLYHGLVRIPGGRLADTDVGNSLVRIEHVVGRPIKVAAAASSDPLVLHLGYEDDDLSDNSYDEHDDGTEDQCRSANGNDGGPASVTITICRDVATCPPPPSRFPFDVRSDELDLNGFLYNPHWSWQEQFAGSGTSEVPVPKVTECHYLAKSTMSVLGVYSEPNIPDCTDQAGADTLDLPPDTSANNIACTVGAIADGGFSGHINWFPITLEGDASAAELNFDDDWSLSFTYESPKGSLYYDPVDDSAENQRHYVHSEFDSDETTDNFSSAAWRSAREAVDARSDARDAYNRVRSDCAGPHPTIDCATQLRTTSDNLRAATDLVTRRLGGHAIETGLFGIDGEHGEKSELHAVYAFASNLCTNGEFDYRNHVCTPQNPPSEDVWLMFVRNRGDEGFCSGDIWNVAYDDYTFRLPWRDGMQSASVDWGKTEFQWSDDSSTRPDVRIVPPLFARLDVSHDGSPIGPRLAPQAGVYVTFHLRYPTEISGADSGASIPFVDGALHLVWTPAAGSAGTSPTTAGTAVSAHPVAHADLERVSDEEKDSLEVAVSHLPEADRKKVLAARAHAVTNVHGPVSATNRISRWSSAGTHARVSGPVGPATRKNMRDAAFVKALCEASQGKPYGLPPAICTVDAKDVHHP